MKKTQALFQLKVECVPGAAGYSDYILDIFVVAKDMNEAVQRAPDAISIMGRGCSEVTVNHARFMGEVVVLS